MNEEIYKMEQRMITQQEKTETYLDVHRLGFKAMILKLRF